MSKSSVFLAISYTRRVKVENAIKKYLESKGLDVITGREVTSGGNLCDEIINLIQECDFGVVVYNELRHNISYEWGLLDALKKKVILLKDVNIHIDLDEEISDKKGIISTSFYGEDAEDEIIEQLKKDKGLEKALENNIENRISVQKTYDAKKAAELLVKSNLLIEDVTTDKFKELPNNKEIIKSLEKINNLTAEGHLIKGDAYLSDKKIDKAIEEYNEALKINKKSSKIYFHRGNAYKMKNNLDQAIGDYDKTIEIDPKNGLAYMYRGIVYTNNKEIGKAIESYIKAIELIPNDILVYQNLAEAYILAKDYKKSLIIAQESLRFSKDISKILISKFLIVLDLILQGGGENEEKEFIELCIQNKGYKITFGFAPLKDGLNDSKHSMRINELIKIIEENATK